MKRAAVAFGVTGVGAVLALGGLLSSAQASDTADDNTTSVAGGTEKPGENKAGAAVPPPSELKVLQFNICGSADHCPDTNGVVQKLLESIKDREGSERPDMISLNEVCGHQFDELKAGLEEFGYVDGVFGENLPSGCNDEGYGNAVFTRNAIENSRNMELPNPAGASEERGMLCASTMFYVGCSTHLSTESLNHGAQVGAVSFAAEQLIEEGFRVIVAGDLNIEPGNSALNMLYEDCYSDGYGHFGEGDADPYCTRSGESTVEDGRKIDYTFFDTGNFGDFEGDVTESTGSDHNLLWSTAQLR